MNRPSVSRPEPSATDPVWWNAHPFELGEVRRWRIGPLRLWAERRAREWRVTHVAGNDPVEEALETGAAVAPEDVPGDETDATAVRYSFARPPARMALAPRLADRPVIVRPAHPMTVPAGEAALLYVSTPLWAAATTEAPVHVLAEIPCFRPSDTWFGPSTVEGELCYASRTAGRLELAELPLRPHRAVTPVRIRNLAREALPLERLKVPVELLSLHVTPRGLWTPAITLVREDGSTGGGDLANLRIAKAPPPEAGRSRLVSAPRTRTEGSLGLRAFSRLLGLGTAQ